MRLSAVFICLCLAACAPRPDPLIQGDATATAALLAMPEAQFFAQLKVAQQIAGACPTLGYNERFSFAVTAQKFGAGRRALSAAANQRAVDLELDVAQRSLQARYGIDFEEADLCPIGMGELTRQSALSAVLVQI